MRATALGTVVRLPDGRIGTTVYNGLDGVGIKWGEHQPKIEDYMMPGGGVYQSVAGDDRPPLDWPWYPDAMLRDPYPSTDLPCVGESFEIIFDPASQSTEHEMEKAV